VLRSILLKNAKVEAINIISYNEIFRGEINGKYNSNDSINPYYSVNDI